MKVLLDGAVSFVISLDMAMSKELTRADITRIEEEIGKGVKRVLNESFDKQLNVTNVVIGNVRELKKFHFKILNK